MTNSLERLSDLLRDGRLHTAAELRAAGVPPVTIKRALEKGDVVQYARGLYLASDAPFVDGMSLAALSRLTPGVVCLGSAALFHRLGDEDPPEVWYAVDRNRRGRSTVAGFGQPHRLLFWPREALEVGVESHSVAGVPVRVTSPARTVIDLLRYRGKIGDDVGTRALRDYLAQGGGSTGDLWRTAESLGCADSLAPFLRTAEELQDAIVQRPGVRR